MKLLTIMLLNQTAFGNDGDNFIPNKSDISLTRNETLVGRQCSQQSDCGFLPALACVHRTCRHCTDDSDCSDNSGDHTKRCKLFKTNDRTHAYCIEKDLFDPFTRTDIIATTMTLLITALGAGCGVGGGGLLVPSFIVVVGLSPKHAIPLSKATIFGTSVANFWFNYHRKHSIKNGVPIINYAMAAIMEPPTLIGAAIGVMLNHVVPNWLIFVLLISLLTTITLRTFIKGNRLREKETKRHQTLIKSVFMGNVQSRNRKRLWSLYPRFDAQSAARHWLSTTRKRQKERRVRSEDEKDFQTLPPLSLKYSSIGSDALNFGTFRSSALEAEKDLEAITSIKAADSDKFPKRYILPLSFAWVVVFLQAMLRGGHGCPSLIGVKCNSRLYWILTVLPLGLLMYLTYRIGLRLRLDNRFRVCSGYEFSDGDLHWTKKKTTRLPFYCGIAGITAGLLGIGGGMVKGPIMLEMGVLPVVQVATANFMILFTSASTTLQFAIAGQFPGSLQYDYAIWFACVGFVGAYCGQNVVAYLLRKYNRESMLVYILAVMIGFSAICMGIVGLQTIKHDIAHRMHLGFSGLCDAQ